MHTSDRLRMFRSLGLAIAALLLVGGAVLGSQAISGQRQHDDSLASPIAPADDQAENPGEETTSSEDASESPEASPEANEDVNDDDAAESPESSASENEASPDVAESEAEDATGDPLASPDDHGGDSGPGGGSNDD